MVRIRYPPAASHERTCVVAMPAVPAVFDTGSSGGICPGNSQGLQSRSVQRLCGIALTRKGRSETISWQGPLDSCRAPFCSISTPGAASSRYGGGTHESSCLVNCAMQRARSGMCQSAGDGRLAQPELPPGSPHRALTGNRQEYPDIVPVHRQSIGSSHDAFLMSPTSRAVGSTIKPSATKSFRVSPKTRIAAI